MKYWERYLFLLIISSLLFSWPLLTIAGKSGIVATYFYIFICWFIVIIGLILVVALDKESSKEDDQNV